MKIAFYIHHTTISAGGIYTYTIGILRQLTNSPDIEKIVIVTSKEIAETLNEFRENKKVDISVVDRKKLIVQLKFLTWYLTYLSIHFIKVIFGSFSPFNKMTNLISRLNPYYKILNGAQVDIFHVPVQYSPIYRAEIPVITTMHDLQEYHYPHYFSLKEKLHRKINNNISINDSDHIVCSFNHVKNDILKFFTIDSIKVSVCPPPFAEDWFLDKSESDWQQIQQKYNIKKNYLLYPAATWEHKNHIVLLEAFKKIRDETLEVELVCTGNKTNFYLTIENKIADLKLSESVHFLGIVPEAELICLYKNSYLVVIPTLYEAGSGPLYEAMRYKLPVICSNVTSLPDTVDNDEFLFDPNDAIKLAEKIRTGLTNLEFRRRNVENSVRRIEELRKTNYVINFINVYKKLRAK